MYEGPCSLFSSFIDVFFYASKMKLTLGQILRCFTLVLIHSDGTDLFQLGILLLNHILILFYLSSPLVFISGLVSLFNYKKRGQNCYFFIFNYEQICLSCKLDKQMGS